MGKQSRQRPKARVGAWQEEKPSWWGTRRPGTAKAEGGQEGFTDHQPSSGRSQATHGETQELGQEPAVQECSGGTCGEENGGWELLSEPQGLGALGGRWEDGPTFVSACSVRVTLPACHSASKGAPRSPLTGDRTDAGGLGTHACLQKPLGLQGKPTPPSPVEWLRWSSGPEIATPPHTVV